MNKNKEECPNLRPSYFCESVDLTEFLGRRETAISKLEESASEGLEPITLEDLSVNNYYNNGGNYGCGCMI
jgi:hypothetical protein